MKMKYLTPIILIAAGMVSCNPLEVSPTASIPAEDAIENQTGLRAALTGAYNTLQSASIAEDVMVFGDLGADNLVHIGTKKEYRQVSDHLVTPDNAYIDGIWNNSYECINQVNNILAALPEVTGVSDQEKQSIQAQALFLRAFNYFNLLKYFDGVPVRLDPTRGITPEETNLPRQGRAAVFTRILDDLGTAAGLVEGTGRVSPIFADEGAIQALMARVYLENGDYASAVQAADKVLNMDYNLSDGSEYALLFDESVSNEEIIFQIDFANDESTNGLADWFLPTARFEVAAWETKERSSSLNEAFSDQDLRKTVTIQETTQRGFTDYYGAKYQDLNTSSDNIIVLRLAEMYLIRAEALNQLQYTADGEAFSSLNAIRLRAGLPALNAVNLPDQESFLDEVLLQRRLEFAFEGHRYFDLKRNDLLEDLPFTGDLINVNEGLYPIPQSEMDANDAMDQNQNY